MTPRLALIFSLLLVTTSAGTKAQEKTWQYCDSAHAYYPAVTACAVPWRTVIERPQFPSQSPTAPTNLTGNPGPSSSPKVISHATEPVKPESMNGWCAKVSKPSSVVICSDPDLRRMSMARTQLFKDAAENLGPETYKRLLDDQNKWVKSYAEDCGTPADGPAPTVPIAQSIVDCYKEQGRARISFLISTLQSSIPNYEAPSNWVEEIGVANRLDRERQAKEASSKADRERQEAVARGEREQKEAEAAEKAREQLRQLAAKERRDWLTGKLKDAGFALVAPVDLELDWRELSKSAKKVALVGKYIRIDEIDGLAINNKDEPVIRLYTDEAARDARKIMLECRTSDFSNAKCRLAVGGVVRRCVRNQGQLNEKEIPCIAVIDAFIVPEDVWDTIDQSSSPHPDADLARRASSALAKPSYPASERRDLDRVIGTQRLDSPR